MIGICGYYQNDKSALAGALRSYVSDDRYVIGDINVNDILVRLDLELNVTELIYLYKQLLQAYKTQIDELSQRELVDRISLNNSNDFTYVVDFTPIDIASYIISSDVCPIRSVTDQIEIEQIIADCVSVTCQYFDVIVALPYTCCTSNCDRLSTTRFDLITRGLLSQHQFDNWWCADDGKPFPSICWIDQDNHNIKQCALDVDKHFKQLLKNRINDD